MLPKIFKVIYVLFAKPETGLIASASAVLYALGRPTCRAILLLEMLLGKYTKT